MRRRTGALSDQVAVLVFKSRMLVEKNKLIGANCDRNGFGCIACADAEQFSGGGVTQWRDQCDSVVIQDRLHALCVNFSHGAAVQVINSLANANRPGRQDVSCHHANERVL